MIDLSDTSDGGHRALAAVASSLPTEHDALLTSAMDAVRESHAAVMADDAQRLASARRRYRAIVLVLNGGTSFGSMTPEGAGTEAAEYCRAPDGAIPLWFQRGRFLTEVRGTRCVVDIGDGYLMDVHFGLHAVDPQRGFFSGTGYQSVFVTPSGRLDVLQAAQQLIERTLIEQGLQRVDTSFCRRDAREIWPWVPELDTTPGVYTEPSGQVALAF